LSKAFSHETIWAPSPGKTSRVWKVPYAILTMLRPAESRNYIGRMGLVDYRGLLAELVPSSAAVHAIGPGICGPCPWEF
jgi:hypothetical protein